MKTSKHSLRFHTFPISLENGFPRVHSSEHTAWNVWSRPRLKNPLTPLHDGERGGGAMPQSGMSCQSEFSCFKSSSWCPPPPPLLTQKPPFCLVEKRMIWWQAAARMWKMSSFWRERSEFVPRKFTHHKGMSKTCTHGWEPVWGFSKFLPFRFR